MVLRPKVGIQAVGRHVASHETGGSDELSIENISGYENVSKTLANSAKKGDVSKLQTTLEEEQLANKTFREKNEGTLNSLRQSKVIETASNILQFRDKVGTGNDWSPAFQYALDEIKKKGGGSLYVPPGEYFLKDEVTVHSNTILRGAGYSTNIRGNGQFRLFKTTGGYHEGDLPITRELDQGGKTAYLSNTTQFASGDHVRILGQRIATSAEDNEHSWVLGGVTSDNDKLYHGEFKVVEEKTDTSLKFSSGVIFPGYRHDNTKDTHQYARPATTIRKMNFTENVEVSGFRFSGSFSVGVELSFALNSTVKDVTWKNATNGQLVSMRDCLNCVGENLVVEFDKSTFSEYSSQAFYIVSSTGCGFRNSEVYNGNTAIDITYGQRNDVNTTSQFNFIENCKTYYCYKGMTVHGGSIGTRISDNQFMNSERGIETRSRETIITGNSVTGIYSESQLAFGVHLYDGYAEDCVISNNIIKGMYVGVLLNTTERRYWRHVGAIISDNQFVMINKGIMFRDRQGYNEITDARTIIADNKFRAFRGQYAQAVMIQGNYRNFKLSGNEFYGNSNNNAGVFLDDGVADVYFDNNSFEGFGDYAIWIKGITNTALHGSSRNYVTISSSNVFDTSPREDVVQGANITFKAQSQYGSLIPHVNDRNWLGNPDKRFRILYTNRAVDVSSDQRLKTGIETIGLGIDFVNSLKPVSYQRVDSPDGTEIGLVAQDLRDSLEQFGVDPDELSILSKDENGMYGVKYTELIPVIIKALQELYSRQ